MEEVEGMGPFLKALSADTEIDWKLFDKLDPRVRELILERVRMTMITYELALEESESPIEQLLAIPLQDTADASFGGRDVCVVNQQSNISTPSGKTYRVDFFLAVLYKDKQFGFVVECDGHDFHEKTKQQAQRDKARDRALQAMGYPVFRFTGSEIWSQPERCVTEVFDAINERLRREAP